MSGLCLALVYFTALVGCAFSSPKRIIEVDNSTLDNISNNEKLYDELRNMTSDWKQNQTLIDANINNASLKYDPGGSATNISSNFSKDNENGIGLNSNETSANNITVGTTFVENEVANETTRADKSSKPGKSEILPQLNPFSKEYKAMVQAMHLEAIKARLLSKLRLDKPPELTGPRPVLPLKVLEREFLSDERSKNRRRKPAHEFYAKTIQVFVMGTDVTSECYGKKGIACYYFDLEGKVNAKYIHKAELWIYKLFNHNDPYNQQYLVSELTKGDHIKRRTRQMVKRRESRKKQGWVTVDMRNTVNRWLRTPRKNDGLSILCSTCYRKNRKRIFSAKPDTRPFLLITTRKGFNLRVKRTAPTMCTETSSGCCMVPLTINLRNLGWSGMIHPQNIEANYCAGSCHEQTSAHYNHTQIIQDHRWTLNWNMMRQLTPCCAPVSYSPLSLMYMINNSLEVVKVPNLIATACGCV